MDWRQTTESFQAGKAPVWVPIEVEKEDAKHPLIEFVRNVRGQTIRQGHEWRFRQKVS
jgi:hypothetical protein